MKIFLEYIYPIFFLLVLIWALQNTYYFFIVFSIIVLLCLVKINVNNNTWGGV
jgi:hypothetical protein